MATKNAVLTIDDSPSTTMDRKVDLLSQLGIVAVWFCTGQALELRPDSAVRAIKAGQILGNHGFDHQAFSKMPLDECRSQIHRTDAILEDVYRVAGVGRPARYFRFPYGDKGGLQGTDVFSGYTGEGAVRKDSIQNYLAEAGYSRPDYTGITYRYFRRAGLVDDVDWYWTYDVMDWSIFDSNPLFGIDSLQRVFDRMEEDVPEEGRGLNNPGSAEIVLTHDHDNTADYFGPIVNRLVEKGIRFVRP